MITVLFLFVLCYGPFHIFIRCEHCARGAVVTALFRLLFTLKGEVIKTAKSLGDRSDVNFMFISKVACMFCKLLLFHLSNLIFFQY